MQTRRQTPRGLNALLTAVVREQPIAGALLDRLDGDELDVVAQAAVFHGITGYLHRAMRGSRHASGSAAERLYEWDATAVAQHMRTLTDLQVVARVLDEAGVPWAVVKGPALVETLYGDPALRPYTDLDVVVPAPDFGRVVAALDAQGIELLDRNWPLIRRHLAGELHFALPLGTALDLHWQLLFHRATRAAYSIRVRDLLDRRVSVPTGGMVMPMPDPADTVVHLAVHAAAAGGYRLGWLKDLELAVSVAELDFEDVIGRAREWGVAPAVGLMLMRARRALAAQVPPEVTDALLPNAAWQKALRATDTLWPPGRATTRGSPAKMLARASRSTVAASSGAAVRQVLRPTAWSAWRPRRSRSADVYDEVPDDGSKSAYLAEVEQQRET